MSPKSDGWPNCRGKLDWSLLPALSTQARQSRRWTNLEGNDGLFMPTNISGAASEQTPPILWNRLCNQSSFLSAAPLDISWKASEQRDRYTIWLAKALEKALRTKLDTTYISRRSQILLMHLLYLSGKLIFPTWSCPPTLSFSPLPHHYLNPQYLNHTQVLPPQSTSLI